MFDSSKDAHEYISANKPIVIKADGLAAGKEFIYVMIITVPKMQ